MSHNDKQPCDASRAVLELGRFLLPQSCGLVGLDRVRAQNPSIPIVPFPSSAVSVKLTANTLMTIEVPDSMRYMKLAADGVFYVAKSGAKVPTGSDDASGSVMSPTNEFLYIEGIRSFTVISESAIHLTAQFFN